MSEDKRLGRNLTDLLATMGPMSRVDKTGEPPVWLDEDAALHRSEPRPIVGNAHREAVEKLAAIRGFVDVELEDHDAVDPEGETMPLSRAILTSIREILDGEVKP